MATVTNHKLAPQIHNRTERIFWLSVAATLLASLAFLLALREAALVPAAAFLFGVTTISSY